MKKYVKPELYYEDFELSTHIAVCVLDMSDYADVNNCSASSDGNNIGMAEGETYFANEKICGENNNIDDYCYTKGAALITIFNS